MNSRARNWRFTENNPEGDLKEFFELLFEQGKIEYAVYQLEVGEEGTEHHQGMIVFKKQTYFKTVKKLLPRANLDVAYSPADMRNYCMKEESRLIGPYEIGIWHPPAEKLNAMNAIRDAFKEGKSFKEVALEHPGMYVRYTKGMMALHQLLQPARNFQPDIILIIGPPGTGKTRQVHDAEKDLYVKPHSLWWDGYYNQEAVLFDDFYGWIQYSELLTILDRYPVQTQFKGGYVQFNSKRIYFTSNKWPHEWYRRILQEIDINALLRRFTKLIYWDYMEEKFITAPNPKEILISRCT